MRIAFLIRSLSGGGAERAAVSLAGAMARRAHTVTLLVLMGDEPFYTLDPSVRVLYMDLESHENAVGSARDLLRRLYVLRRTVRTEKPDVLVGMSYAMSTYAVLACAALPTRTVGTERANPFLYRASKMNTVLRKLTALCCNGFVCQTQKALSFFPNRVQKKAAVIPNGLFNPLIETISVPNDRQKVITAMGRLDRNKGFDLLLHAFKMIHEQEPSYTLTIYGEGQNRNELEDLADTLGIRSFVSLPGNDPKALEKIAASSAFVLSSRSEGMPNALMEAMAAGVPCVATRCNMGPEELIRDGENGLLVPTENADAIAAAVLHILRYRNISDQISHCALQIRQTHALEKITDFWLEYFGTLL